MAMRDGGEGDDCTGSAVEEARGMDERCRFLGTAGTEFTGAAVERGRRPTAR